MKYDSVHTLVKIDHTTLNKKWWNNAVSIHMNTELYNLSAFKKGKSSLGTIELEELKNVRGKTLLHLMCHFGMDTLSWAREGALVTGVDLSDNSIRHAEQLSKEIGVPATFICSDVYKLTSVLNKKFDIVFTSYGVLLWLSNIKGWAKIIYRYLKKGGIFYIVEHHPFTNVLTHDFKIQYKYFDKGAALEDSPGTYADWNADIKGDTYMWSHTMSDVINSLIEEGLKIQYIHEFPFTIYDQFPGFMRKNKQGQYVFKKKSIEIPLLFSLKTIK